jgi:hypothetical protein
MSASRNVVRLDLLGGRVHIDFAAGGGSVRVAGYGASIVDTRRPDHAVRFCELGAGGAPRVRVGPFMLRALLPPRRVQPEKNR